MTQEQFLNDINIENLSILVGQIIDELPVEIGDEILDSSDKIDLIFNSIVDNIEVPKGREAALIAALNLLIFISEKDTVDEFAQYLIELLEKKNSNIFEKIRAGFKLVKAAK